MENHVRAASTASGETLVSGTIMKSTGLDQARRISIVFPPLKHSLDGAGDNITLPAQAFGPTDAQLHSLDDSPELDKANRRRLPPSLKRTLTRDAFSEFLGTMVLILFGDGVVAQVVLSNGTKGDYQSISWGWGIGVMMGVYVGGKSGGHLNPAVTFCNALYRRFPWRNVPVYMAAQLLGAMAGAAMVYANYRAAIDEYEGGPDIRTVGLPTSSAGIFCTYPAAFMTRTGMFFSEFIASAILMLCIYGLADNGAGILMPVCLFFLIFGIGACFGWETGYAINLARDFGPRLVSAMVGYGREVFTYGHYYFWIPIVAPFLGCAFGGFLYDVLLYSGDDSPLNEPWFGVCRLLKARKDVWSNTKWKKAREAVSVV